ncbi:MAG: hypothetical protein NTX86_00205 [Candidatus Dependentiae bacterium]|nr:hypothetical protein [Candidatus Dependentiae bacterium]
MKKLLMSGFLFCCLFVHSQYSAMQVWDFLKTKAQAQQAVEPVKKTVQAVVKKQTVNTAIDVGTAMTHRHGGMKSDFHAALDQLKASKDFSEIMIQRIVELLDAELMLVHCLLNGHMGEMVDDALVARNDMLSRSTPSMMYMYDKILNLVTYNEQVNGELYRNRTRNNRVHAHSLNWRDKREFLMTMYEKLEHYSGMMRAMQCDISIGDAAPIKKRFGHHARHDRSVSFSPLIR